MKRNLLAALALPLLFILFFAVSFATGRGSFSQPAAVPSQAPVDCSTITDQQIFDEIKKALQRKFKNPTKRAAILKGLNLTVKNKVVKLQGSVPGNSNYINVLEAVKSIEPKFRNCIQAIDVNKFESSPPIHCDPLTEDTCPTGKCVTKGDPCNEIG